MEKSGEDEYKHKSNEKKIRIADLSPGSHIHLMGVCGTAMASLAGLLKGRGFHVTGSDSHPYPPMSLVMENLGIPVSLGYHKENLSPRPDYVIVGNVISATNEEAQELMRLGIPYASLPQTLGEEIIGDRECIVVSGTHGKTTTTSLMAWVAEGQGLGPGFLIGGLPKNFPHSFENPKGSWFVIEGDEYDTAYFDKVPKFIHYRPRHVILTSVEFDHADIYRDLEDVKAAFRKLMVRIPQDGSLVYWGGHPQVVEMAHQVVGQGPHCWSYGLVESHESCTPKCPCSYQEYSYLAQITKITPDRTHFRVKRDSWSGDFNILLSGEYNVLNATAVVAMAHQLGWDMEKVEQSLASFEGVKRRQEILGEPGGVLVIEDFAHHPTAVRETLKGLRLRYPERRIFAVYEPRSATSRRRVLQNEYTTSFDAADFVILAQAYDQSKIPDGDRFSSEEVAQALRDRRRQEQGLEGAGTWSPSVLVFPSASQIVDYLVSQCRSGDLVLVMSNGGFDGIYAQLLEGLAPNLPHSSFG